uniref:Uncharacterized protein n=1 Tax=Anopheles farauti TaxID=69004 RepID=A0A182QJJ1_9DIPT
MTTHPHRRRRQLRLRRRQLQPAIAVTLKWSRRSVVCPGIKPTSPGEDDDGDVDDDEPDSGDVDSDDVGGGCGGGGGGGNDCCFRIPSVTSVVAAAAAAAAAAAEVAITAPPAVPFPSALLLVLITLLPLPLPLALPPQSPLLLAAGGGMIVEAAGGLTERGRRSSATERITLAAVAFVALPRPQPFLCGVRSSRTRGWSGGEVSADTRFTLPSCTSSFKPLAPLPGAPLLVAGFRATDRDCTVPGRHVPIILVFQFTAIQPLSTVVVVVVVVIAGAAAVTRHGIVSTGGRAYLLLLVLLLVLVVRRRGRMFANHHRFELPEPPDQASTLTAAVAQLNQDALNSIPREQTCTCNHPRGQRLRKSEGNSKSRNALYIM